ncbi:hypothetical protein BDV96DRAFT_582937 [Lophiotrema nucula]|uniref:Uncharacterized protein n=1 Tax=Lophiotrema nucula TaxID=690887 RepID=A0A6A5YVL1_9PLEO|nr:hypothetical protein BDV96DRAFT_582937 [Lophiotrema nucula]
MAFEATPDIAGRPFKDLRSARRAANRQRKHKARYNNFKQLKPSDLPSHPNQQPHLLPTCCNAYCDTYNTVDHCAWSTFPADLSTALSAKFTKREAYDEVKGWRNSTPRYHNSVKKDLPKHQKQKKIKRINTNEAHTKNGDWIGDLESYDYVDLEIYLDTWRDWDDDYYHHNLFAGEEDEIEDEEDEGYYSDNDGKREFSGDVEWNWHRTLDDGQWFATKWRCTLYWCQCDKVEEKERKARDEAEAKAGEELEKLEEEAEETFEEGYEDDCDLCYRIWHGIELSDMESEAGEDWDVVSNASEAWTEVDEHDSDIATW